MFTVLHSLLLRLAFRFRDTRGQDLVEYALVAAMISLGAVAGMRTLASDIATGFSHLATTFNADI